MDGEADALNWTDLRPRPIRLIIRKEPIFPNHRHIVALPFDDGAVLVVMGLIIHRNGDFAFFLQIPNRDFDRVGFPISAIWLKVGVKHVIPRIAIKGVIDRIIG